MSTIKTYMITALAIGAFGFAFSASDAFANHKHGKGKGRGYGKYQYVDVYVDAGRNPVLERAIGEYLVDYNPYANIVYSPRYADVTVYVNGYLSRPDIYRKPYGRYRYGYASLDYNYKVKIRAGRRIIYRDRIYGEVTRPLPGRYGFYRGSYGGKRDFFPLEIIADIAFGRRGHGYRYGFRPLEKELRLEAYERVAEYIGHIRIPRKYGRYR